MTLNDFIKLAKNRVKMGWGNKEIFVEGGSEAGMDHPIDSIQSNTNPGIEPDYIIIMVKG